MLRYVQRDITNRITGCYPIKQPGFAEELLDDSVPELASYLINGIAKTASELDADKDDKVNTLQSGALIALATALFQTINDVRTLKGQATINSTQYKAYLKSLLP